jgi:hypothetical protein
MEPVSRAYLRGLKAQTDEENRIRQVEQYVASIYSQVKNIATTTTQTRFQYQVQDHHGQNFMSDIMPDVLIRLHSLFPESNVHFKTLSRGKDGKLYDIANVDERMKPFIDSRYDQDFIVIDWS